MNATVWVWSKNSAEGGNRLSQNDGRTITAHGYTHANRLTLHTATDTSTGELATTTLAYDPAGNQTLVQAPAGNTYLGWNAQAMMATAEVPAGTVTFTYNAHGQRVGKESYDGSATGFLYDHKQLLQETEGIGGGLSTQYASTTDQEYGDLISEDSGDGHLYHQYDGQWGTEALTDPDGNVEADYRYRAFGLVSSQPEAWRSLSAAQWGEMTSDQWASLPSDSMLTAMGPFGQTGAYLDAELGLLMLGMGNGGRHYDPSLGRFVSEDPIRQAGGDANLYPYAGNDPVNGNDPSGHEPVDLIHRTTPAAAASIITNNFDPTKADGLIYMRTSEEGIPSGVSDPAATVDLHLQADPTNAIEIKVDELGGFRTAANDLLRHQFTGAEAPARAAAFGRTYNRLLRSSILSRIAKGEGHVFKYRPQGGKGWYYVMDTAGAKASDLRVMKVSGPGAESAVNAIARRIASFTLLKGRLPVGALTIRVARFGGRALLVYAVAKDVYEIATATNHLRTAAKKIAGWGAGLAAAETAGDTAIELPIPHPVLKGAVIVAAGAIGFAGGYLAGEKVIEEFWEAEETPGVMVAIPTLTAIENAKVDYWATGEGEIALAYLEAVRADAMRGRVTIRPEQFAQVNAEIDNLLDMRSLYNARVSR